MTNRIAKLLIANSMVFCCFLLTGCPIPVSNMGSESDYQHARNDSLPYSATSGNAIVYIVPTYKYIDWYMVGGAASDGIRYRGSRVYVKGEGANKRYAGTLTTTPLCFYTHPGNYVIEFENLGGTPKTISRALILANHSENFIALESDGIESVIHDKILRPEEGKFYLKKDLPKGCLDLANSSSEKLSISFSIKMINNSQHAIHVSEFDSNKHLSTVLPSSTYVFNATYLPYKDNAQFEFKTTLENPVDKTKTVYNLMAGIAGLQNFGNKQVRIRSILSNYSAFSWETYLRAQSICHSKFSGENVAVQCVVKFHDDLSRERAVVNTIHPDSSTTMEEIGPA